MSSNHRVIRLSTKRESFERWPSIFRCKATPKCREFGEYDCAWDKTTEGGGVAMWGASRRMCRAHAEKFAKRFGCEMPA